MTAHCAVCGDPFRKTNTAKTCGPVCSKALRAERYRARYAAHPEELREKVRAYRAAHPEEYREYQREYQRAYRAAHVAKNRDYQREYQRSLRAKALELKEATLDPARARGPGRDDARGPAQLFPEPHPGGPGPVPGP